MDPTALALPGLFAAALVAATILPAQSEAVLVGLLLAGSHDPAVLFAVATAGNVLGSAANWALGRWLARFRDRRWFPVSGRAWDTAERRFRRFGLWSLAFAWVPIVGDPLTVVAGALRVPFAPFLALVAAGKAARYAALVAATLGWIGA